MSIRPVVPLTIALGALFLAGQSHAQRRPTGPSQPPDVLPPPSDQAQPQGGNGPATDGSTEEKKKVVTPAAGYAYADKAPATGAPRSRYRGHGPVVNIPGFEQTSEGGSRLFVQLSQSVPVEERKAQGSITYVLRGASPRVWNNTNALVTVHFNTPVSRARLVPQGHDLLFVVELRAAGVTPTWKMNEGQDKTAMLAIDFPKGDYLQLGAAEGPSAASTPPPARAARPQRRGGRAPAPRPPAAPPPPETVPKP